jgi:hypothetical protein
MCGLKNNTVLKSCEIRAPATTHILQLQSHAESRRARSLLISNSRVVVTRTTVRFQLKGSTLSGESTQCLQLGVCINLYNSNHSPVATEGLVQYEAEALSICNSEDIIIATRNTVGL